MKPVKICQINPHVVVVYTDTTTYEESDRGRRDVGEERVGVVPIRVPGPMSSGPEIYQDGKIDPPEVERFGTKRETFYPYCSR